MQYNKNAMMKKYDDLKNVFGVKSMKKGKSEKIVSAFTIVCALITLVSVSFDLLLPLYLSYKFNIDARDAGSIGIIGGADGPTTIYLSGQFSLRFFTTIFALLTMLGIIYLVVIKYKKNHN